MVRSRGLELDGDIMFPKNTRFLIVDDFTTMRKVIKKVLSDLGYTDVSEAPDGPTAIPMIQKAYESNQAFGFIICDYNMPHMSGAELLAYCKSKTELCQTPFVLITADIHQKNSLVAAGTGVSEYLIKPFNSLTLKNKLDQVWNHAHTESPIAKAS